MRPVMGGLTKTEAQALARFVRIRGYRAQARRTIGLGYGVYVHQADVNKWLVRGK